MNIGRTFVRFGGYFLSRLGVLILMLLVTSFIVFGAMYIAPGSPLGFILQGQTATPETIAAVKAEYHLDDPFFVAYGRWLGGVVQGDLGTSVISRESVWSLISPRLGPSLFLVAYAALLITVFGVGVGIVSALRSRRLGPAILTVSTIAMAIPAFVTAVVLLYVFGVELGWFPVLGAGSGFTDRVWHLTLPAISLALVLIAYVARITNVAVTDELGREYVETARARGLPYGRVVRRHVVRNALIPVVTLLGLTIASLIAGTAIVETAFGINGIGAYLVQSVQSKDFPVVQALVLLIVLAFAIVGMIVDALYSVLDPRIAAARG